MTKCAIRVTVIVGLMMWLGACATVSSAHRPDDYYASAGYAPATQSETQSLFTSDGGVLSDADIKRILSFRYAVPRSNRIGIVALERPYWFGWSDELARAGASVQQGLVTRLRASPLVYDASYLPQLLIPGKRTVGHFREAAARYQADLLLIYRASCRTYERWRLFEPDRAKSYCNVEAVLLDVRTGIVPFTATASRDFTADEKPSELNSRETVRRAEVEAVGAALAETGDTLVRFLGGLPKA